MLPVQTRRFGRFAGRPRFTSPNPPQLMANMFNQLQEHVASLEDDFNKFYEKGNKAAGTRVRKGMQELKQLAQDIRVDIQDKKNAE